ncbi:MAG: diadenosine tetraphosphate hydrolase [Nocardioides sp.]
MTVPDFRADRVGSALAGTNPTVLRRLGAGFAVIADVQHLPGYCVLITDTPGVDQLTDLDPASQLAFLDDAALLARAVSVVCRRRDPEFRRINIEVQGNTDAFLHAHVTPRYEWEPDDIVGWPAALHHWTGRVAVDHQLGPQHDDLRTEITAAIDAELTARRTSQAR